MERLQLTLELEKFGKRISKAKKRLFQKDKIAIWYLIEKSATPEDIAHTDGNIRSNEDISYTSIIKATQKPIITQPVTHVTADIKLMKQITGIGMTPM